MRQLAQSYRISLTLILLVSAILGSDLRASAQQPGRELSLQEYVTELRSAAEALEGTRPATTHNFRTALPPEWVVRIDGQSMRIKTDWLDTALLIEDKAPTASTDRVRQARQRVAALLEAAGNLSAQTSGADLSRHRAQIDRILREREFQGSREPSWLDKLKARVYGWIWRHLERLFGHVGISSRAGDIIAWTLVSLAGLLLALWAVRAFLATASRSEMDLRGAAPAGLDWRYWAKEARAAAERGDYRAAIHAAYWGAVTRLEENHLLPQDRSRTPRESLRMLQQGSAAYSPLAQLTRRFELTWYGYHAATPADWDDAVQQLETLGCLRSSTPATAGS